MLRQRVGMKAMEYLVSKKEKADAAKELKKEERFKKTFALQEERIIMEREKMEFKREMEEEKILNIDMSTLSYKQQQYYERRQDKIIVKHLNN
jgi:ribonucleotide monophosphatase NagD (HAD superfamily)